MSRLYRPHIPVETRCRVALAQLGEIWVDHVIDGNRRWLGKLLANNLAKLAGLLGCEVKDLRLDHDPPLAARPRFRRGLGKKTFYQPDANDPAHLRYRPHGPQFDGSHLIKTNVRGDHGQFPDRVLIKRERKRQKGAPRPRKGATARRRLKGRGFPKGKTKWPSRPFAAR